MRRNWDSSGISSKDPHMLVPALLTHTSIPPKAEAAAPASWRTWAGSVTSVGTGSARRPPSASQSCVASSSSSRRRAARTTLAPRRAKAWAVASPMPLEAPVITTVASRRLLMTIHPPFHSVNALPTPSEDVIPADRSSKPLPGSLAAPAPGDFEDRFARSRLLDASVLRVEDRERRRRRPFFGAAFGTSCTRPWVSAESEDVSREPIDGVDRLSVRTRPPGLPIMHQHWGLLLFMHWSVPARICSVRLYLTPWP